MHGVELDGVFLSVPLRSHGDGQGFIWHGEQLPTGGLQLSSVQVYLIQTTWRFIHIINAYYPLESRIMSSQIWGSLAVS